MTVHTNHGKWSDPGVPHKGWSCVGIEDLGEPSQTCEMCESIDIRYAHVMSHPDYPGELAVGCVCAENMEEDYVRPKQREKAMRSAARRRKTWARRVWKMSHKGNSYINTEGFNLTVFRRDHGWMVSVANRLSGAAQTGKKIYATEGEAKHKALDALLWAKEHLRL